MNTTRGEHVKVNFDISFPNIPCNLLSLDSFDEAGSPQKGVTQFVYKHKLDKFGNIDTSAKREKITSGDTVRSEKDLESMHSEKGLEIPDVESEEECGNCYGAGREGSCCNTCDDVRRAYELEGWLFKPHEVKQCQRQLAIDNLKSAMAADGGCQVYGWIDLPRSSGHFHIAPHKDIHTNGVNNGFLSLLDLISFTFEQFNVTHTVNSLGFGMNYPGIQNPLDAQTRLVEDTHGMYQYYLKVVPTQYLQPGCKQELSNKGRKASKRPARCRKVIESNQYSVTEHMRHLSPNSGRGLPGVYFYYEISPVQAVFEVKEKSIWTFITTCCAIIGGVYTVVGMLDGFLVYLYKLVEKSVATTPLSPG